MSGNGYQEYTGDRHTLPRENPVATRVVEELNMIWQNQNGGNHTSSPMRGRCASQSASATTGTDTEKTSVPNSICCTESPLQQMTGLEAGIKPLRRKKPPVARPPQEKKTKQEISGADNELAKILNRRRRKNGEDLPVQNMKTLDEESKNEVETILSNQQEELNSVQKKVIADKPKLEPQLLDHHHDLNSSVNQLTKMEADLGRLRTERDELRQVVTELSQKSAHLKEVEVLYEQCQQKSIAQTAIIENQHKQLNDLKREVPGLKGALTKQHTEIQQVARQRDELMGDLEAYQQTVRQYENDFNEERAARERAAGEQESERRRHQFEMQVLKDNLKDAVESERVLKQHATKELDELRRKQTGLETDFSKALAMQASQLDTAQAEKAEIRQQNDGLNLTVKQYEANIQQLLADKESSHELQGKIGEFECVVRGLKVNLEGKKNENRTLGITVQQLKKRTRLLEARDELTPYDLPQLPNLGECQGAGSYGSVYRIHLNGINCIAKRIHDILLGQGREKRVNIEDKRAAYHKFYTECVLLSRMRHPNIVQFMGVHYGPQRDYGKELTLVMERLYMNLEDCLHRYQNIEMWLKVSILLDISQGLLHLHSQGIIHRDLTAPNILLTTSFHAKIADLGVSRIIDVHPLAASKQSMIPGTLGYMPPEALAEIPEYGSALDIFSFGVLILFVIVQEYPQYYDNLVTPEGLIRKESHIQKRSKWINKLSSDNPFCQLICGCLRDVPAQRPTTKNLNSSLIQIAKTYPKPYQDIIDMQTHLAQPQHGFPRYSS